MKYLATIRDNDLFSDYQSPENIDYKLRVAPRAVVFDEQNKVAVMYVGKFDYYKLPGGGQEEGETLEQALIRECQEEIGCNVEIGQKIGSILEYRDKFDMEHITRCFICKVKGDKSEPLFTPEENASNYEVKWVDLTEAIDLVKNAKLEGEKDEEDHDGEYAAKFIMKRELIYLEKAKEILDAQK
ncbi:NUDIX domain-containing protein [bacterium]|nr:NUDIX domain-containing protein [bacterium]